MKRSVNLMLGDKVKVFTRDSYYTIKSLGVTMLDRNDAVCVLRVFRNRFSLRRYFQLR